MATQRRVLKSFAELRPADFSPSPAAIREVAQQDDPARGLSSRRVLAVLIVLVFAAALVLAHLMRKEFLAGSVL